MELRSRTIGTTTESSSPGLPGRKPRRPSSMTSAARETHSPLLIIAGWLVHLYTATGALVNAYALLHAFILTPDFHLFAKLNWLAIFIDATDGTIARAINVQKVIPTYDGALLDNLIDFQTFAVLPALAIVRFEMVPNLIVQYILTAAVLVSSAYAFCQTQAKTPEAFVGFPSYWNIVVFYIYYLSPPPLLTSVIVITCALVSFIPVHFIYPTKTRPYMSLTLFGAYIWGFLMLFPCFFPQSPYLQPVLHVSLIYVFYYIAMSLHLDRLRRLAET